MIDALGEWMMQPVYHAVYGGQAPRRAPARDTRRSRPTDRTRASDGTIYLGVQSDREWATLCRDVLARPELIDDPRFARNPERVEHDDELTATLEAAFADQTAEELLDALDRAGIACARVRTPTEFFEHPQLAARDRWRTVTAPGGPIQALAPPVTVRGRDAAHARCPGARPAQRVDP